MKQITQIHLQKIFSSFAIKFALIWNNLTSDFVTGSKVKFEILHHARIINSLVRN